MTSVGLQYQNISNNQYETERQLKEADQKAAKSFKKKLEKDPGFCEYPWWKNLLGRLPNTPPGSYFITKPNYGGNKVTPNGLEGNNFILYCKKEGSSESSIRQYFITPHKEGIKDQWTDQIHKTVAALLESSNATQPFSPLAPLDIDYYHGDISSESVGKILKNPGDYLVRNSNEHERKTSPLVLSMRHITIQNISVIPTTITVPQQGRYGMYKITSQFNPNDQVKTIQEWMKTISLHYPIQPVAKIPESH